MVNGPDVSLGQAIVTHPGIDMVTFTGGVPAGRSVMAAAAATTKPVVLELGGNDPAIIAPDMEIDESLADRLVGSRLHHQRAGVHGRQARLCPE